MGAAVEQGEEKLRVVVERGVEVVPAAVAVGFLGALDVRGGGELALGFRVHLQPRPGEVDVAARVRHVERVEDVFLDVVVQRHAGDGFDDEADPVDVDAVHVRRARVEAEGGVEARPRTRGEVGADRGGGVRDRVAPVEGGPVEEVVAEARGVRQALEHCRLRLGRAVLGFAGVVEAVEDLDVFDLRDVLLDRVVEREFALLHQLQGRDAGDDLGAGPHYRGRAGGVGRCVGGVELCCAEGGFEEGVALAVEDDGGDAGDEFGVDGRLESGIEFGVHF